MYVLNTLAPVFLIIALGAVLRRTGFLSAAVFAGINRLVYWVALPIVLFFKLAVRDAPAAGGAGAEAAAAGQLLLLLLTGQAGAVLAGYLAARGQKLPAASAGALVQGAFRGNLVYVGLPVLIHAFSTTAGADAAARAERIAILSFVGIVPAYNVVAVVVLLAGRHSLRRGTATTIVRSLSTNPLILGTVAGALASLAGLPMPPALRQTMVAIGQAAMPLALLCVGGAIASTPIRGNVARPAVAAAVKLVVSPAIGWAAALLLGADPHVTVAAMILLGAPTAVASYVLADQLGADAPLAAGAVVVSSVLSVLTLAAIVAVMPCFV